MTDAAESLYDVLGLDADSGAEEIRDAYRKLAQQWHPDKHPDNVAEATQRFQRIADAYQTLADEARRARYDDTGSVGEPSEADELTQAAIAVLTTFAMQAMVDQRAERSDLRTMAEQFLLGKRRDQEASIKEARFKIKRCGALAKRWKRSGAGPNIFANALRREVRTLKDRVRTAEKAIEIGTRALAILGDYSFEFEGSETVAERERRLGMSAVRLLSGRP